MDAPRYDRPPISLIESDIHPYGISLYVGGMEGASDLDLLKASGISTVVNCAVNLDFNYVSEPLSPAEQPIDYGYGDIRYYKLGLIDGPGNPETMFVAGYYLLRGALDQVLPERHTYPRRERGNVLVNCRGGRSRSVALTALLTHKVMGRGKTAAVLSGGNIDTKLLSSLIERGMLRASRYVRLFTAVDDRPGGLARILKLIADTQGNVIEVIHNRSSLTVPLSMTGVEIQLETRDAAHVDEIVAALKGQGYPVQLMP